MEFLSKVKLCVFLILFTWTGSLMAVSELRTWTMADGKTVEAKYKSLVGKNAILENSKGKLVKVPLSQFSEADREFIELENPPDFRITFRKKSAQKQYSDRFSTAGLPSVQIYTFGGRVEKRSAGSYPYELTVEFFAIAAQRHYNNKFILADRQSSTFTLSKENDYTFEFLSPVTRELEEYVIRDTPPRGEKYDGYLVVVYDKRGKVIASKTPNKWLFDNLENLKKLSPGNYMDTTCTRVYPGRPAAAKY
jgi:hypothetical protein